MVDFYKGTIPVIDVDEGGGQSTDMLFPKGVEFGLVPRDYSVDPEPMFDPPGDMVLWDESDYDALYDEQEELKSSLEHVYLSGPNGTPAFENLDQNGDGYCWSYSVGHSVMIDRLVRRLKHYRLNPHSVAAIIKRGANQGGWCGLAAQFGEEHGYAIEGNGPGEWPLHSRNLKYDTPELRASMKKFRIQEQWVDLTRQVYDRNLTMKQVATCGFNNIVGPGDYNWWRHSVCRLRWVRIERGSWGQLILNSWPGWGRYGLGVLRGNQAICNGALGVRLTSG